MLNRKKEVSIWEKKTFMGIGAVTWYQYASYIGQIYMSGPLGTITFFLQQKTNLSHKNFPRSDRANWFPWDFIHNICLLRFFILGYENLWEKIGRLFLPQGAQKIEEKSLHSIFSSKWKLYFTINSLIFSSQLNKIFCQYFHSNGN